MASALRCKHVKSAVQCVKHTSSGCVRGLDAGKGFTNCIGISGELFHLWVIKTPAASVIKSFDLRAAISIGMMMTGIYAMLVYLRTFRSTRHRLALESVALRQQLAVYKRRQPRPKLNGFDRLFWVVVRQIWTSWSEALILVKPETVVSWHRAGYRLFWRWRSRRRRPGAAEGNRRDPGLDPPNEEGESDVGSAAHPWRVASTRLRDLRTYCVTVSATPEAQPGRKAKPASGSPF